MSWLEDLYIALYALAAACGIALICIVILAFCGVITCSTGAGIFCCSVKRRKKNPDGTVTYETCCQSCCGSDVEPVLEIPVGEVQAAAAPIQEEPTSPRNEKMEDESPPDYHDAVNIV